MREGKVRSLFPGANSSQGFYSLYNNIIEQQEATRIFIMKGGPGVGKSTFMRSIGEELRKRGYDIEHHCCSTDPSSLDGLVIPKLKLAIIDGTAPHVVDPVNPGASDEIIHLGDYWDEAVMQQNRQRILDINKEYNRLFQRAYNYLAQAKILHMEIETYYTDGQALDFAGLNEAAARIIKKIFQHSDFNRAPRARHLFASAITPDGAVNNLDTLFGAFPSRFIVQGDIGTGKSTLVKKIYDNALLNGLDVEAFHCSLNPERIEHLIIPSVQTVIITSASPHVAKLASDDTIVDTSMFVRNSAITPFMEDMEEARLRYQGAMERAIHFLRRVKQAHDDMETCYTPNMDFEAINARRDQIFQRILKFIEGEA